MKHYEPNLAGDALIFFFFVGGGGYEQAVEQPVNLRRHNANVTPCNEPMPSWSCVKFTDVWLLEYRTFSIKRCTDFVEQIRTSLTVIINWINLTPWRDFEHARGQL